MILSAQTKHELEQKFAEYLWGMQGPYSSGVWTQVNALVKIVTEQLSKTELLQEDQII